jgi:hypothetical protein
LVLWKSTKSVLPRPAPDVARPAVHYLSVSIADLIADEPICECEASVVRAIGRKEQRFNVPNVLAVTRVNRIPAPVEGDLSFMPCLSSLRAAERKGEDKRGDEN